MDYGIECAASLIELRRSIRRCSIVLLALLMWPADVSADEESRPKVAIIAPLSGELSALGDQLAEAASLAARERGIEVRLIDEGEDVETALQGVRKAAKSEQVVTAIGPVMRGHTEAVGREAQRLGLPLITFSSASGVERQGPMIFRARLSPEEQAKQVAGYLAGDSGAEKIAIVAPESGYGRSITTALVDAATDADTAVTAVARYEPETTDFGPILERLIGRRALVGQRRSMPGVDRRGLVRLEREGAVDFDTLIIADSHTTVAQLLPFLPRLDISTAAAGSDRPVQLIGLAGWRGDGLQRVSQHLRGAVFFETFGGDVDGSRARQFTIEYREMTDREVTTPEAEIYDLVSMLGETQFSDEPGANRSVVVDHLSTSGEYDGVTGLWAFDRFGAPLREMKVYRVGAGGTWTPLSGGGR